jgi:hypothetical protein
MATVGETSEALWSGYSTDSTVPRNLDLLDADGLDVMIRAAAHIFIAGGEAAAHGGYSGLVIRCSQ